MNRLPFLLMSPFQVTGLYSIRCLFVFTLGVLFNFQGANTLANQGLVDLGGLEPPTSRLSGVRSNLLSYKSIKPIDGNSSP